MTMCTLNHDGSIHAVAMWYGFLDGSIAIETKAKAQKAVNLGRDPRITCMFEDGDYYEELRGVELVGTAEIVDDPDQMWELGVNLFERYYGTYTEELRPFVETMLNKRIVAKVNVERTVSWDHRKLGLPSDPVQPDRAVGPTGGPSHAMTDDEIRGLPRRRPRPAPASWPRCGPTAAPTWPRSGSPSTRRPEPTPRRRPRVQHRRPTR